mgnify:CR=1 FL=1
MSETLSEESDFSKTIRSMPDLSEGELIAMLRNKVLIFAEEANCQLLQRFRDSEVTHNAIFAIVEDYSVHSLIRDIIQDHWDWLLND